MRLLARCLLLAACSLALTAGQAQACHSCKRTPCAIQPQYQCVTDWVPYTVMQTRMRTEWIPCTRMVTVREPVVNWVERQRVVCRPVYDVRYIQRQYTVCRPVYETTMVNQTYTVCRPITTPRQVTMTCMQPFTRCVTVPVVQHRGHCGLGALCGKRHGRDCCAVGCTTVLETCYQPVQITCTVYETQMVSEVQSRQVPVTTCRWVSEIKTEQIPVTSCRWVQEVVTERIPCTTFRCVTKPVTTYTPRCIPECVPVTCYRPVTRMVPCAAPTYLSPQMAPLPSFQGASSQAQANPAQAEPRRTDRDLLDEAFSALEAFGREVPQQTPAPATPSLEQKIAALISQITLIGRS
jgi:hypothetical protein